MTEPEAIETPTEPAVEPEQNTEPTVDQAPSVSAVSWPEGAREAIANGDDKLLKELNQFTDLGGVVKSYKTLRQQRDSGEYRKALPDNPNDDELAAYRKSNGLPDSVDDYKLDTSKLAEEQIDFSNSLAKLGYDLNQSPKVTQAFLDHLVDTRQQALDAIAENDSADSTKHEDTVRELFGSDYRVNMNMSSALLDGEAEGFKDAFLNARLPDGTLFSNSPEVTKFMVDMARQINPVAAIMPAGASDMKSVDQERAELKKLQTTNPKKYYSGEVQDRLMALTEAKTKAKS